MAESTMSVEYGSLAKDVGRVLGYGHRNPSLYDHDQMQNIEEAIRSGLRRFYFPPRTEPNHPSHEWSFLRPNKQVSTIATYTETGSSVAISSGIVSLSGGTFPTWSATDGILVVAGTEYEIATRDSGSQLTLADLTVTDVVSTTDWSMKHDSNYLMDDDFGGIDGPITFTDSTVGTGTVRVTTVHEVMRRRQNDAGITSRPEIAAVRPRTTTGSPGQRFDLLIWPRPDAVYELNFRANVLPSILTSALNYPYGGAAHAETLRLACLASAEMTIISKQGARRSSRFENRFMESLISSVDYDRRANAAENLGYNGDRSDGPHYPRFERGKTTYNGTLYD